MTSQAFMRARNSGLSGHRQKKIAEKLFWNVSGDDYQDQNSYIA